jgi:hypothetical protein
VTGDYGNPSADKFGPPPGQERFEAPKGLRVRSLWSILPFVLYFAARVFVPHIHGRGWLAFAGLALAVAVAMADMLVFKRLRDRLKENDQVSSSDHITR